MHLLKFNVWGMVELASLLDLGGTDICRQHSTEMRSINIATLTVSASNIQTQVQRPLKLLSKFHFVTKIRNKIS